MQEHGEKNSNDLFYARVFAIVTLVVLGIALYQIVLPFVGPIAWAMFIAFLLQPLQRRLVPWLKGRVNVSAMLLTLLTLIVLIGPLTALGAAFISQTGALLHMAQGAVAEHTGNDAPSIRDVPMIAPVLSWLDRYFNVSAAQVQDAAVQGARNLLQFLASMSGKFFLGALGTVVGFTLMMFMLFFFVRDGAGMFESVRALIPLAPNRRDRLLKHVGDVIRAVVFGTGLTALLQGALVSIAFLIVGLPSPVVFGALAALLALLPVGGTALVWGPGAIVLAAQGQWGWAIFLLVWGMLLVGTIDNLLRPILVSGRAPVGTLTVFVGVLGGAAAFGTIGLFLGPVVLALAIALMRFLIELRKESH